MAERVRLTAQGAAGETALLAYSTRRSVAGPNGEWDTAFLLWTCDRGATWRQIPFARDVWSFFRYPGFPVWPPEFVSGVQVGRDSIAIDFRDEEIVYEPGGESLWTGRLSRREVWRLRRLRKLRYEPGGDDGSEPAAIALALPDGFREPDRALVERAAARAGRYLAVGVPGWLWCAPGLAAGILIGAGAFLTAVGLLLATFIALPVIWLLLDRRRQRREAAAG